MTDAQIREMIIERKRAEKEANRKKQNLMDFIGGCMVGGSLLMMFLTM